MISLKIKTLALLGSQVEFTSGDRAFLLDSLYDGLQPKQVSVAGTRPRIEFPLSSIDSDGSRSNRRLVITPIIRAHSNGRLESADMAWLTRVLMQATDTSQRYLLDAYLGEIRGEATFRLLAEALPERAGDLHMLAEVERVTAAYLSHHLLSPVSMEAEAECRAAAKRRVTAMSIDSWAALLEGVTPIVQAAVEKFKAAEAHAPRELLPVYQTFTAHELVLADYLRLEQDGQGGAHLLENYIERVAPKAP